MPGNDQWPPGPEVGEGRSSGEPADVEEVVTSHSTPHITSGHEAISRTLDSTADGRQCTASQKLQRRRRAADRCVPLWDGCRDPWTPWRPEKLSEKQVEAAALAAQHLADVGMTPVFDLPTLRALWRAGHHQLVDDLRGGGR